MIRVEPQPEPPDFDEKVRQPGRGWLRDRDLEAAESCPRGTKLKPFWRSCLPELHARYHGICAYVGVYLELVVSARTVDHMVAKSSRPALAYEWGNYRLACSLVNSRKRDFQDVLDPFEVETGMFHVDLVSGRIYAAPGLPAPQRAQVEKTIGRLGLDTADCRRLRANCFLEFVQGHISADFLQRRYPVVWVEAQRQGLLEDGPQA